MNTVFSNLKDHQSLESLSNELEEIHYRMKYYKETLTLAQVEDLKTTVDELCASQCSECLTEFDAEELEREAKERAYGDAFDRLKEILETKGCMSAELKTRLEELLNHFECEQ